MEFLTAEEASQDLLKLIEKANRDQTHFNIISEHGNVVVLSDESYQNLIVTLELLATPGLLDGIQDGIQSDPFSEEKLLND